MEASSGVPWCWQEGRTEMVERDEVASVVVQRWKAFLPLPVASVSWQVTVCLPRLTHL